MKAIDGKYLQVFSQAKHVRLLIIELQILTQTLNEINKTIIHTKQM